MLITPSHQKDPIYGPVLVESLSREAMLRVRLISKPDKDGTYKLTCDTVTEKDIYVDLSLNSSEQAVTRVRHLSAVNTVCRPNGSHRIMTTIRVTDAGEVIEISQRAVLQRDPVLRSDDMVCFFRLLPKAYGRPIAWCIYGLDNRGVFVPEAKQLRPTATNSSVYAYHVPGYLIPTDQGLVFYTMQSDPKISVMINSEPDLEKNYIKYADCSVVVTFYADLTVAGIFVLNTAPFEYSQRIQAIDEVYETNGRRLPLDPSDKFIAFSATVTCEEIEIRNLALLCYANNRIWVTIRRMQKNEWDVSFVGTAPRGILFQNRLKRLFDDRVTCTRFRKLLAEE